jgi:DNA-binding transcriptional LysR family regulator
MKIDQLIYFVETAKEEHIGRAAKVLGISPSAISHSVAALEGELQIKLFQKKGKNIFLTNEGQKLLDKSYSLITQFKNLKYDLLAENEEKGHYNICATHTLCSKFVTQAWLNTQKDYTKSSIDLLSLRSSDVIKSVLSKTSDIGICISPQDHPDLEITKIYEGQLYINVRKRHPFLKGKKHLSKISEYACVLPKSFQGIEICLHHPMFEEFNIVPDPKCLDDCYDTSQDIVARSDYWRMTPDILIDQKKLEIIKPSKNWKAPYFIAIVWRKNQYIPSFFNDFTDNFKLEMGKFHIKK